MLRFACPPSPWEPSTATNSAENPPPQFLPALFLNSAGEPGGVSPRTLFDALRLELPILARLS
jgi:hypothetical protein